MTELKGADWITVMKKLKSSEDKDVDKIARAFGWVTNTIIEQAHKDIEISRALKDRESIIKHQIKREVMKSAREIFNDCYRQLLGRQAWHE